MRQQKNMQSSFFFLAVFMVFSIAGCQQSEGKIAEQIPNQAAEPVATPAVTAAPNQTQAAVPSENAPVIKIEKPSVNFGQAGPSTIHKAEYKFTNSGKSNLSVSNIQSTCGCSVPALKKDDQSYPVPLKEPVLFKPGESGLVEVTFTAPASKGSVTKHIYIVSDDPVTPSAELTITAEVTVQVEVSPENVELRLDQDNAGMSPITVKSLDGKEFSIKAVTVANNVIAVPFDVNVKKTDFVLKPEVDLTKLAQFNTGVIQIKTDHPQAGTLLVRYTAKPKFEVTRQQIILQNIEPQVPLVKDVIIRSNYGAPVDIESVKSTNGYMAVESQEKEGNNVKMMIKITPPARASSTQRYITDELTVNLKSGEKLSIRCSGWFRTN